MPDNLADNLLPRLLVLRAQAGDAAAFEELIREHQARLRLFLHKMVPGHADDLAQEVWLDAFRDLPRLSDPAAFTPWLYRVARNRAYRHLRRRTPAPSSFDQQRVPDESANGQPDFTPDDAAAVHAALDRLTPEHREVLLLRFIEDMSYDDIAAATGVPVGTVRSRLHNAKAALRTIIETEGRRT
jgi:RNA polymerase sigma-70 factor (ECF subfamily)